MHPTMTVRHLHLSLQAAAEGPCHLSWRIDEGYLRISRWCVRGDPFTLGLWGPGDLVILALVTISPIHRHALCLARVEEAHSTHEER
jgi:hypothetical protein